MLTKSNEAAALTTAPGTTQQNELYGSSLLPSSKNLQQDIGELLFCLEFPVGRELRQLGWELFERLLRRYIDRTVLPQGVSEQPESTNARQRVS